MLSKTPAGQGSGGEKAQKAVRFEGIESAIIVALCAAPAFKAAHVWLRSRALDIVRLPLDAESEADFTAALTRMREQGRIQGSKLHGWRLSAAEVEAMPESLRPRTPAEWAESMYDQLWERMQTLDEVVCRAEGLLFVLGNKIGDMGMEYDEAGIDRATTESLAFISVDVGQMLRKQLNETWGPIQALRAYLNGKPVAAAT